jgi:CheY-like chemotaxis protein
MSDKTVLVVEDNPDNRRLLEFLLTALGHHPVLASNGREGVECTRREHPDLVLMDVHMPEMDGYQAAALIRADPELDTTPIVAITADAMAGDRDEVLSAGFDGYISKPIMPEDFGAQIGVFLDRGHEDRR